MVNQIQVLKSIKMYSIQYPAWKITAKISKRYIPICGYSITVPVTLEWLPVCEPWPKVLNMNSGRTSTGLSNLVWPCVASIVDPKLLFRIRIPLFVILIRKGCRILIHI